MDIEPREEGTSKEATSLSFPHESAARIIIEAVNFASKRFESNAALMQRLMLPTTNPMEMIQIGQAWIKDAAEHYGDVFRTFTEIGTETIHDLSSKATAKN